MAEPVYPGSDPNRMNPPAVSVVVIPSLTLGSEPAQVTCPHCNNSVVTRVNYVANNRTHLNALVLCLLCGCIPGCIPYCCNSCQSAVHTCPVCNEHVGTYEN